MFKPGSQVGRAQDVPDVHPHELENVGPRLHTFSTDLLAYPDSARHVTMHYRRSKTPGATYFFTVVTYRRRPILCEPDTIALLREAFKTVKQQHPFVMDAIVILPDHLHGLWTLPADDADYSTRWMLIKSYFTHRCPPALKTARSEALRHKREQTVWQRRYWEHQIRDERDFERYCDYIHYNPVKHGHVVRVAEWPYSSFHRLVREGVYPLDWVGAPELVAASGFGE